MDLSQLVQFTQDIVRLPSLSGEEEAVARRVEAELRRPPFDRIWTDANGSVVGIIDGAQPGKTLLFDAHTDTVGISPGVPWQHDPFGAQIDGDALFGRGAADMKGALAAMVYAAASSDCTRLRGRIVVSASTLEEVLEGVALQAVMDAAPPDFVVIGEATNLNLSRGGRGRAEVHLTTVGRPAHSSSPHLGRNAVLDMMAVIAAVEAIPLADDPFMGPAIFRTHRHPLPAVSGPFRHPQHLPCHLRPPPAARGDARHRVGGDHRAAGEHRHHPARRDRPGGISGLHRRRFAL